VTAAVIVTYNSREVIGACVDACLRVAGLRVIVVDNASVDGTAECVGGRPGVEVIVNQSNAGFAAAVNQGIAKSDADLVLVLNPDVSLTGEIGPLEACFEDPRVGAAAGRLIGADGHPQTRFQLRRLPTASTLAFEALGINRLWPSNPVNRRYRPALPETDFEQPAGAFLMVRRAAWQAIGGFDETFFPLWFEDVDFIKRMREDGWSIAYEPRVTAKHLGGHSANQLAREKRETFWYGSLLKYASKHFAGGPRRMVSAAVMMACIPRSLVELMVRRSAQPLRTYSKVFRLAARCFIRSRHPGAQQAQIGRRPVAGGADAGRSQRKYV
jgi:GT2 family glycosyltransferase